MHKFAFRLYAHPYIHIQNEHQQAQKSASYLPLPQCPWKSLCVLVGLSRYLLIFGPTAMNFLIHFRLLVPRMKGLPQPGHGAFFWHELWVNLFLPLVPKSKWGKTFTRSILLIQTFYLTSAHIFTDLVAW